MEPIISPWFFYIVDKVDPIRITCSILATVFLFLSFFLYIDSDEESNYHSEEYNKKVRRRNESLKKTFIISVVLAIVGILTPSSETIYKMQAAKYVTPNNIKEIANTADETVDILINKIIETNKKLDNSREK